MHIQAHKQQRKGFSSFYSWSYIIKGVVEIRCVGVVVVMLVSPCLSRGCLWVWFCIYAMYFLCMYILFILWIAVSKNVTCHTVLLATKINNICGMKQSDQRVLTRNIAEVDFLLRRRNSLASPCMCKKYIAQMQNWTHRQPLLKHRDTSITTTTPTHLISTTPFMIYDQL